MPSKEEIKAKLCVANAEAAYPLQSFMDWAKQKHNEEMLRQLEQIQYELYGDECAWQQAALHGNVEKDLAQARRWCAYCAQVRVHYQAVVRGQHSKEKNAPPRILRKLRRLMMSRCA